MLIRQHSFGGSVKVEISAELFGIGAKAENSFTCKTTLQPGLHLGTSDHTFRGRVS